MSRTVEPYIDDEDDKSEDDDLDEDEKEAYEKLKRNTVTPNVKKQETPQVIEREINLSLINDKLNHIINVLSSKK